MSPADMLFLFPTLRHLVSSNDMHTSFAGKKIVVGVTGSIAAFKVAGWVSTLAKDEALVTVIMTESAKKFVSPLTFAALSGEKVLSEIFPAEEGPEMPHINLGKEADLMLIAPATAQTIARLAHGFADDLLSATVLAAGKTKIIVCPAMNPQMYAHSTTLENLAKLKSLNYRIINPDSGMMACKDEGQGRLPEWETVKEVLLHALSAGDLAGKRVLVTAGPTREALDPARFLSNRSSGKMGYALARAARRRGAEVILVSGPTVLACPEGVQRYDVRTAEDMRSAVLEHFHDADIIIKAAAVSDFRPEISYTEKVKKEQAEMSLRLVPNPDILQELGKMKKNGQQLLVGFAAESSNLLAEGKKKLEKKNLDLIAVNDISRDDRGFEVDMNQITLIDRRGVLELPYVSKDQTADLILDHIVGLAGIK
jgi:phosphopantothenoylcysteine decarboxylase / phosphopantothenate---cysteine ligase